MRAFNPRRVRIAKYLEYGLKFFYPFVKRILPTYTNGEIRRVVVFEAWQLGDFVMATPAFRFLRHRFPEARIDCISPPYLEGLEPFFPWLDKIIPFRCPWTVPYREYSFKSLRHTWKSAMKLRALQYDWAFDLRGDIRDIFFIFATGASRRASFAATGGRDLLTHIVPYDEESFSHQLEGNLLVVSYPFAHSPEHSEFLPEIRIPPEWQRKASQWLQEREITEFVSVHPGSSLNHNMWPVSRWAELLNDEFLNFQIFLII